MISSLTIRHQCHSNRLNVLLRPETEAITSYLASLLSAQPDPPYALSILDLCTGTGCIPLLLQTLLSPIIPNLQFCGVDVSQKAIKLAKENLAHNIRGNHLIASAADEISFVQGDIFQEKEAPWKRQRWDILVSNPPYISPTAFDTTTSRSVRNYEPKTALVPTDSPTGDAFYPRLLHIANRVGAQIILAEVGNITQAARVAGLFCGYYGWKCEIWRDEPAAEQQGGQLVKRRGLEFGVKGAGNGRAVLAWRRGGGRMLGLGYQGKS